jgi:hypothetical protein
METAPVDFDAKQLFQSDIAEMHVSSKMIQKGELTCLVRSFEHYRFKSEYVDKPVCVIRIQVSILIKESNSSCAFSGFDNELNRSGIEPLLTLVNPPRQRLVVETAVVLLSKFHLNIEATAPCSSHNFIGSKIAFGESLAAFNSSYANVGAEVQVRGQLSLSNRNFKGSTTRYRGNSMRPGQRYFHPGCVFIGNHPARH